MKYTYLRSAIFLLYFCFMHGITQRPKIKEIAAQQTSHSYIILIKIKDSFFIVKQKINIQSNPKAILKTVLLSELIKEDIFLHMQEVDVIPAKKRKYPKHYKEFPASIHKVVPGRSIREWIHNFPSTCPKFFLYLKIQQRKKRKYLGLTHEIINAMTKHKEIPAIVACNTLFGDYDCHRKNIFYDEQTNHFFLIDSDSCFKYNLCELAIKNIKKIIKEKIHLSKKEIKVLKEYALTLENLIKQHDIDTIIKRAQKIVKRFKSKNDDEIRILEKEVNNIKQFLIESYQSAQRLIQLIDTL